MGCFTRKCRFIRHKLKKHWMTIVWVSVCIVVFYLDYMRYKMEPQYYYLRRMLGIGMCISRGTAAVLNLSCCVLVVPMCRALATNVSAALKSFLSYFHLGNSNLHPPPLPALLTSGATQTAKSLHMMIAVTVIISSVLHTGAHIGNAINFSRYYNNQYPEINVVAHRGQNPFYLFITTVPGITGVIMMVLLFALAFTSTKWARHRNYNAFFYTHHLGMLFFALLITHPLSGLLKEQKNTQGHIPGCQMFRTPVVDDDEGFPEPEPLVFYEVTANESTRDSFLSLQEVSQNFTPSNLQSYLFAVNSHAEDSMESGNGGKSEVKVYVMRRTCSEAPVFRSIQSQTWIWMIIAVVLWIADSAVRWWRQRAEVCIVNVVHHPCDIVQFTLKQSGFSCKPGQYVLLQCPSISRFEWHPFTITCPPSKHTDTFTILMRVRGDWSRKVADRFQQSSKSCQHLPFNLYSKELLSHNCPVASKSSQRAQNFNYTSSQASCVDCDLSAQRVLNSLPLSASLPDSDDTQCYRQPVKKSNSYSFTPRELNKKIRKPHSQSVFCTSANCMNSDFLFANVLLSNANRWSLPLSYGMNELHSEHLEKSTQNSKLAKHTNKFSSNIYSKCPVHKHYIYRKCCHRLCPQHIQKITGIHNHTLCHYSKTCMISSHQKHKSHTIGVDSFGDIKKDHRIDIDSPLYPRLCVDGPYSSPNEEMLQYPIIIGAAGGVGITPLAATLSHKLWYPAMWPKRIHMVWVVRDARLLLVIAPLLCSLLLHSWQTNTEDSIELRLHVTIPTTKEVLQDLFGKDYSVLLPRISQGRPNWKHLFQEWSQVYTRRKVGVFTCGPPKMCRQVRRHSLQAVTKGVNFNYHQESFS